MSRNRHTTEQIVGELREAEARLARGRTVARVAEQVGVTVATYYRWREEDRSLNVD